MLEGALDTIGSLLAAVNDHPETKPRVAELTGRLTAHLFRASTGDQAAAGMWAAVNDPDRRHLLVQAFELAFEQGGWPGIDETFRGSFVRAFLAEARAIQFPESGT